MITLILQASFTAFGVDKPKGFLPAGSCLEVYFSQRGVFEGEEETYRGVLIKENNSYRLVYFTNPPFEVVAKGDTVVLGYRGGEKETFKRGEYKNPVLEVLFHLDHPREIFEVKPMGEGEFLLTPRGELSEYVEKVILYTDGSGRPKRIEVFGGDNNYIVFKISKIEPACGGNKIEKP